MPASADGKGHEPRFSPFHAAFSSRTKSSRGGWVPDTTQRSMRRGTCISLLLGSLVGLGGCVDGALEGETVPGGGNASGGQHIYPAGSGNTGTGTGAMPSGGGNGAGQGGTNSGSG